MSYDRVAGVPGPLAVTDVAADVRIGAAESLYLAGAGARGAGCCRRELVESRAVPGLDGVLVRSYAGCHRIGGDLRRHLTMALLTRTEIPGAINSIERLFVWAAQCLSFLTSSQTRNVYFNEEPVRTVQVNLIRGVDGSPYFQVMAHVRYDELAINSATAKTWMAALDETSATLPASLKTD